MLQYSACTPTGTPTYRHEYLKMVASGQYKMLNQMGLGYLIRGGDFSPCRSNKRVVLVGDDTTATTLSIQFVSFNPARFHPPFFYLNVLTR